MLKEYYKILGLTSAATEVEVKRAYRKLAIKFHPDTNPGNESKFLEISEAYQVLTGKKKPSPFNFNPKNDGGNEEKIFVRRYNKWMTKTEYQELVKATQNYHKQKLQNEKEENDREFEELKNSKASKWFKYSAVIGAFFSVLLLIDYYAKPTLKKGVISNIEVIASDKEDPYGGYTYQLFESYITIKHKKNRESVVKLNSDVSNFLQKGKTIKIIQSSIFNLSMGLEDDFLTYDTASRKFKEFQWFLVIFCCLLIVLTPILKAPTSFYYMLIHLSTYGIPFTIICFMLYVLLY